MIHGAVGPGRAVVTLGESVQLEALARPGELVGGDPLLDLAQGLLPSRPPAFRQGLLEGYAAAGPLDPGQRTRLRRLGLIALIADAATCPGSDPALPDRVAAELAALGHAG